jgi:filamentous hemagglutinin family protein
LKKSAAKIRESVSISFEKTNGIFACKKSHYVIGFMIFSQVNFSIAQVAVNTLPTGGQVVAGQATISQTQTPTSATMNINQTSQRAVVNWDSFNVGKNAQVNFNQPNAQAVILNRVTGASASMIDGAVRANGQVVLVNPNGVTFGKGADINAGAVVATTMNIANKDFMEGKSTFRGDSKGSVVNQGKIAVNNPNGYIALLAPEVRNEGYLLAQKGPNNAVALAAGEQITLDFRGDKLISVNVDKAVYGALIENKRVIEVSGGLIVVAAGAANQLMGSVIKNTGRISASTMVNNGGVIELVAANVTQAGTVAANSTAVASQSTGQTSGQTTGKGGQVHIAGENITLAANSTTTATGTAGGGSVEIGLGRTVATNTKSSAVQAVNAAANNLNTNSSIDARQAAAKQTAVVANQQNQLAKTVTVEANALVDASATQQGNAGNIVIWSEIKTSINGMLKAVGGMLGGNGGFIETSSKGAVTVGNQLKVNTSAPKGNTGLWLLDPIDLVIDAGAANVISAALENNNVTIEVNGNVCPSLGSCTQNGSGSLTIASGADILKAGTTASTLRLISSGIFNLNSNIAGENLNVIINSSIAYLNVGTSITASQVTVQAQTIHVNGNISAMSSSPLSAAIQLLAQALYISGRLSTSTSLSNSNSNSNSNTNTNTNTVTYNGTLMRAEDLPTFLRSQNNGGTNLDQVYSSTAANDNSASNINTQTNSIYLQAANDITLYSTAEIKANGTTGGYVNITAQAFNAQSGSLIQANGNNGPGGAIHITTHDARLAGAITANGANGGSFALSADKAEFEAQSVIQTNGSSGPGGTISIDVSQNIDFVNSGLYANGTTNGGEIRILSRAGNLNLFDSVVQTNGSNGRGGSIETNTNNGSTSISSALESSGATQGGNILITANHITLENNSSITATGNLGGGTVLVGGDWQGSNGIYPATTVTMSQDAVIDASALINGDGGKVVLWSDVTKQNSMTTVKGRIFAKAGLVSGDGGQIETSGYNLSVDNAFISTQAPSGKIGEWLLDPRNITISSGSDYGTSSFTATADSAVINVNTLTTALASTHVTVFTGSTGNTQAGNITVSSAINAGGANTLTLRAAGDIIINADITRSSTGGLILRTGSGSVSGTGSLNLSGGTTLELSHGSTVSNNIVVGTGGATIKLFQELDLQVLVVAGGGAGGGSAWAGGGGGGGVIYGNTSLGLVTTSITVGAGGSGTADSSYRGANGGNSQFGTTAIALGGGGGGGYGWGNGGVTANGAAGGSGGGAGEDNFTSQMEGGVASTQTAPSGWTAYGNPGGSGSYTSGVQAGSGGGGAGSSGGGTSAFRVPGNGGAGITFNISGSSQTYGGGGGGATCWNCGTQGSGGSGGGGGGGDSLGTSGTDGLGGGGGGSQGATNASGGSGVVIVRYAGTSAIATGGTVTTSGNSRIHTFSTVGSSNFVVNGPLSSVLSGAISGTGSLTINATGGAITLSGTNNTYGGNTTISAGALSVSGNLPNSTAVTVSSGSTYNINTSHTIGSLAGAGNVSTSTSGAKTLTVGNDNSSTTFSGIISDGSGSLALTKTGSGTQTLSGNNTYSGLTTVNAGTLRFAPSSGFEMILSGGIINNSDVQYEAASTSKLFFDGAVSGAGTWTVNSAASNTAFNSRMIFRGTTTTSGQVTVTNYGNFWLEGTSINATSPIYLDGANTYLRVYGSAGATIKAGTITGNGTIDFSAGGGGKALSLSTGHDDGTGAFGGLISNSGVDAGPTVLSIIKAGTGSWTLSGTNSYTGTTTISAGTLSISADANLGTAPGSVTAASLNLNGGTLALTTNDVTLSTNRGITLGANSSIDVASGRTLTYGGVITDGASTFGLTKAGSGTLVLSGTNTYDGGTTISAGTLAIGGSGQLGSGSYAGAIVNNGTFLYSSSADQILSGAMSGSGALTKDTSTTSTLTLSGANTYRGTTTISTGYLALGADNALSSDSDLVLNGTLNLAGYSATIGSLSGSGTITNALNISMSSLIWYFDAGNKQSYIGSGTTWTNLSSAGSNGTISGTPVYNASNKTITFSGDDFVSVGATGLADFTNGVTVFAKANLGTADIWERIIDIGNANQSNNILFSRSSTGTNLAWQVYNGVGQPPTLDYNFSNGVINNSLATYGASLTSAGVPAAYVNGTAGGSLTSGANTVPNNIARNSNFIGKSNWSADSLLIGEVGSVLLYARPLSAAQISALNTEVNRAISASTLTVGTSSSTTFSGVINNAVAEIAIIKQGSGTLTLSGTNTYTGTTTVNAGTLAITNASALGTTAAGTTIASGATLDIRNISVGAEALTINGGTLLTSTGTSSLSGTVALGGNSTVTVDGTELTLSGDISGSNALTKSGSGLLIVGGTNSYSGGTSINAGTLRAGSATAFGGSAGAITVTDGAALDLNGQTLANTNALTINGTGISAAGALTNSSTAATYAGAITLGSISSIGSTSGAITITGAISASSSNYGLALVGDKAITMSNTSNALRTIASRASIGALTLVNAGDLTIGSVIAGSTTYNGLSSSGTISVKTTGDLTISQNVATTSTSAVAASPAILLAAGYVQAAGIVTKNIKLSGSPTFTAGTDAIIDFYSGDSDGSTGLSTYVDTKSPKSYTYNSTISTQPTAAGYNVIYRGAPPYIYVTIVDSQTGTYGTASGLSYWYSTSPTDYGLAFLPSSMSTFNSAQTFTAGATTISLSGSLSGSITINIPLTSSVNAGTHSLTLTPNSVALSGSSATFVAGTAKNFVLNPKALNIAVSKPYDGNATFTSANTITLTGMANSESAPTISSGSATLSSANVTPSAVTTFDTNSFALSNSNYTLTGGTTSATISQLSSVTYTGAAGGSWSDGANWTAAGSGLTGATPTLANVATVIIPVTTSVNYGDSMAGLAPTSAVTITNDGLLSFNNTSALTMPAAIGGDGAVTFAGSAPVTLTAANTYAGATTINSVSTLQVGAANATSSSSALVLNGTFDLAGYSTAVGSLAGASTGLVTSTVSGTPVLTAGSNNSSTTYAGVIQNNLATVGFTKTGSGTLILSGTNTYSGITSINGGVISVEFDSNLGSATSLAMNAGTLRITGSGTFTTSKDITLNGAGTIDNTNTTNASTFSGATTNGANLLTLGGTGNTTISGVIGSGSGGLTIAGTGTVTLANSNTYTGATTIDAGGTLKLGSATTISNSSAVVVNGTLDLAGYSETVGSIAGASTGLITSTASGTLVLTAGGNDSSTTFAGVLEDQAATSLALVKEGTGQLTLSAANTYSGGTTINSGAKVIVANNAALGVGDLHLYGGTLQAGASAVTLANNIIFNAGATINAPNLTTFTLGGVLSNAPVMNLQIAGQGTTIFTNINTYAVPTVINSDATLILSGSGSIANSTLVTVNGTLDISPTTTTTTTGASITTLSGAGSVNIAGKTLTITNGSTTYSGVMTGAAGALTVSGGEQIFSGANDYTGTTTVSGGTLRLTGSGTTGAAGNNLTVSSTGTLAMVDANLVVNNLSLASGGVISAPSGLSTLTANGTSSIAGTITTSGNQRYVGAVTLTANTSLVSGTGNITFGSTINGTTADTESLGLNAGASGVITFGGAVGGSVRLSDLVIADAGSLALGANTTINIPNAFTLNKPLAGAGYSLGVTNNAIISATLSGLSTISIGGTTSLGGSVTTSGEQSYTGAVVLSADTILTAANNSISHLDRLLTVLALRHTYYS